MVPLSNDSLKSVINQTFREFKIIICNDGDEKILDITHLFYKGLGELNGRLFCGLHESS